MQTQTNKQQIQIYSIEDLVKAQNPAGSSPLLTECQKFIADAVAEELACNAHLTTIVEMHAFVREKLNLLLLDADEARVMPVLKAISALPEYDQAEGKSLFADFLEAWKELRAKFVDGFHVCGNDRRGARADEGPPEIARIPPLSEDNCMVSFLTELPGDTEAHQALTSRMIETVLAEQTNSLLNKISDLRSNAAINRNEYIATHACGSIDLSRISRRLPSNYILTGPNTPRQKRFFETLLIAHTRWQETAAPPMQVADDVLTGRMMSMAAFIERENKRLAFEKHNEVSLQSG